MFIEQENKDLLQRLADSVELSLQLSDGLLYILEVDTSKKEIYYYIY